jgi:acetolactate synthase I/II/III large subunit
MTVLLFLIKVGTWYGRCNLPNSRTVKSFSQTLETLLWALLSHAAIGAAIGSGKKVYCIDGDGGFQMNIQELLTVKKYDLPIEIIILNNSGYGIIKQFQDSYFDSKYIATSKSDVFGDEVDFVKIAEAYGVKTLQDIPIPETQKIYPKLEFGNSLENMTPYIDFEKDMVVPVPPKKKLGWN